MKSNIHKTISLGDMIAAAFDEAARQSTDPKEVSRLATQAIRRRLRRQRRLPVTPSPEAHSETTQP